jgi:hypothetical protein
MEMELKKMPKRNPPTAYIAKPNHATNKTAANLQAADCYEERGEAMLSKHEEQASRLEILENEKRVRNPGTTFHQFGSSEAAEARGRFSSISNPTVIGSTPTPASAYPAAFLQHDPVPDEPKLGVDINAMEPVGEPHELRASIASLGPSTHSAKATPNPASGEPSTPPNTPLADAGLGFSRKTFRRL